MYNRGSTPARTRSYRTSFKVPASAARRRRKTRVWGCRRRPRAARPPAARLAANALKDEVAERIEDVRHEHEEQGRRAGRRCPSTVAHRTPMRSVKPSSGSTRWRARGAARRGPQSPPATPRWTPRLRAHRLHVHLLKARRLLSARPTSARPVPADICERAGGWRAGGGGGGFSLPFIIHEARDVTPTAQPAARPRPIPTPSQSPRARTCPRETVELTL